ncbi:MAG: hypothetical protein OES09_10090 [Gammaproteobacteria bacterium]|nr:hypothetical protein [Gammaproteobacteria bacterium]
MNRRHFFVRLLAGITLLVPMRLSLRHHQLQGGLTELGEVFLDPAAAEAVGRAYLASHPHTTRHTLVTGAGLSPSFPGHAPRARVQAQSHADFLTGNIDLVDGWVLSHAEACACALAAWQARG